MDERSAIRVLIDARKLGDGGIGVYIENLVSGLVALRSEKEIPLELTLFVRPQIENPEVMSFLESIERHVTLVEESSEPYSFSEYLLLARRHRVLLKKQHVFHSPHYTLPYWLKIPSVVTIHDVIHVQQPEKFLHRPMAKWLVSSAVRRASHVITVSLASLARLQKVVLSYRTPMSVIPNAVKEGVGVLPPERVSGFLRGEATLLPHPFYLFIGSDRPHKGFWDLIPAWQNLSEMCEAEGHSTPSLLVVGDRFSLDARELPATFGVASHVRFLGEVSNERLAFLYNSARGVVVPSRLEGFGLPALEAMASGVPVICSPETSLKELCGSCAWYAENFHPSAFASAVYSSYVNSELSESRATDGLYRSQDYSRELVTWKTFEIYESLLPQELRRNPPEMTQTLSYGEREVYDRFLRKAM